MKNRHMHTYVSIASRRRFRIFLHANFFQTSTMTVRKVAKGRQYSRGGRLLRFVYGRIAEDRAGVYL